MSADCPGPENAALCDNPGCRRGGCQGRKPIILNDFISELPESERAAIELRAAELIAEEAVRPACRIGYTFACPHFSCAHVGECMAPTPSNDNEDESEVVA